jgi:hypothetical protein
MLETQEKTLAIIYVGMYQQFNLVVPNLQNWMTVYISKQEIQINM